MEPSNAARTKVEVTPDDVRMFCRAIEAAMADAPQPTTDRDEFARRARAAVEVFYPALVK